jgi:hypothetical protein
MAFWVYFRTFGKSTALRFIIIISGFFLLMLSVAPVRAQLLEDSPAKLKTKPGKGPNKGLGSKKVKRAEQKGADRVVKTKPKYTKEGADKAFAGRKFSGPKYSSASDGARFRDVKVNPRYSDPSKGSAYTGKPEKPRYSQGSPFSNRQMSQSPRYSPGSPFGNKRVTVAPKYSPGSPFSNKQMSVSPRYSPPNPFGTKRMEVSPRYSPGSPFTAKDKRVDVKYSPPSPHLAGKRTVVNPRYSPGSPFANARYRVEPRYSTFKHRFDYSEKWYNKHRPPQHGGSEHPGRLTVYKQPTQKRYDRMAANKLKTYEGPYMIQRRSKYYYLSVQREDSRYVGQPKGKRPNIKNTHPSANYWAYKDISNKNMREGLRKWNIFWTRMNGNKTFAPGMNKYAKKPKFDKKERHIWEPSRDGKSTTRKPAKQEFDGAEQ